MLKNSRSRILARVLGAVLLVGAAAVALYQVPAIHSRLAWRLDFASAYWRGLINPVEALPTPLAVVSEATQAEPATLTPTRETATSTPTPSQTPVFTPTITPTPTPIPEQVILPPPAWIKQTSNNCGPATLAMNLAYYGWAGDQDLIASEIRPLGPDRNVNVEELVYYARNRAGWLHTEYRVGGTTDLLRKLIAAGVPVTIEEEFIMNESYWPRDDRWAGHYLFVTGYDDARQVFIAQDVFVGPNQEVSYTDLDKHWQTFNRVYILHYPPEKESEVKAILGEDWDVETNRRNALEKSLQETVDDPENPFAWFNLGTNYVYFDKDNDAAAAYDEARRLGLPQRMLRYQFGPFLAYFHSLRTEELMTLSEYALQITPNSEEALLWRGWGLYRLGDKAGAIEHFQQALAARPGYADAEYAINFVQQN